MPRLADVAYFNFRPGHSESWKPAAACRFVHSTDPWYLTGRQHAEAREIGKEICNTLCPVREHCLAYAFTAGLEYGTWGGLDEDERRRVPAEVRVELIDKCRRMPYQSVESLEMKEAKMVVLLAKVNFAPGLKPGEIGPVEDSLARAAVRNGYGELVGNPLNFDEWMYHGAELQLDQGRAKTSRKQKVAAAEPEPKTGSVLRDAVTKSKRATQLKEETVEG